MALGCTPSASAVSKSGLHAPGPRHTSDSESARVRSEWLAFLVSIASAALTYVCIRRNSREASRRYVFIGGYLPRTYTLRRAETRTYTTG